MTATSRLSGVDEAGAAPDFIATADAERAGVPGQQRRVPSGRNASLQTHDHLWRLPDGTGLHAPRGAVVRDEAGRLCCHLCGRWFRGLGGHLRVHGNTARDYREAVGLCATEALVATDVSRRISRRQTAKYHTSKAVRQRLAVGQEMARSGELGGLARAALAREVPAQRQTVRAETLDAGRRTRARNRQTELGARLAALGYLGGADALGEYMRVAYSGGAGLQSLGAATGLGRARLRAALVATG